MRLLKHIGLALVAVSMAWSCNENDTKPQPKQSVPEERVKSPPQEQVQPPTQQVTRAAGELDAYGREPGHEHYGHDHPRRDLDENGQVKQGSPVQQGSPIQQGSPVQTQQAPASGEPDKYGRKPGDAHYGHDHPLLEEELNN